MYNTKRLSVHVLQVAIYVVLVEDLCGCGILLLNFTPLNFISKESLHFLINFISIRLTNSISSTCKCVLTNSTF